MILDATAGSRSIWFDKNQQGVLFADQRSGKYTLCDGRTLTVNPDIQCDFRNMPFADEEFHLVIFDPPHLIHAGDHSYLAMKYGKLDKKWQNDMRAGFTECFRVLKQNGTLIFKWSEGQIKVAEILELAPQDPLVGHFRTGSGKHTHWFAFIKCTHVTPLKKPSPYARGRLIDGVEYNA